MRAAGLCRPPPKPKGSSSSSSYSYPYLSDGYYYSSIPLLLCVLRSPRLFFFHRLTSVTLGWFQSMFELLPSTHETLSFNHGNLEKAEWSGRQIIRNTKFWGNVERKKKKTLGGFLRARRHNNRTQCWGYKGHVTTIHSILLPQQVFFFFSIGSRWSPRVRIFFASLLPTYSILRFIRAGDPLESHSTRRLADGWMLGSCWMTPQKTSIPG